MQTPVRVTLVDIDLAEGAGEARLADTGVALHFVLTGGVAHCTAVVAHTVIDVGTTGLSGEARWASAGVVVELILM